MTFTRVWQYTELFHSLDVPGRYLTLDRFTGPEAWHRFLTEHHVAYQHLDAQCADLTVAEHELAAVDEP